MKIALIIGHDANEQGAYGNMGKSEFDFNHEFIRDLFFLRLLPEKHEYNRFYRSANIDDYGNKMIDLHKKIDEWGADVSIEFHFNSFHRAEVTGNEVLYCSSAGMKIASKLNDAFINNLENKNRGIKKVSGNDRGAGFCCRGKSLAIISEPFFGAHQSKFSHDGNQRKALFDSFVEFLNSL